MNFKYGNNNVFSAFNYILFSVVTFITIYPIIYAISISLSDPFEIMKGAVRLYPIGVNFDAYKAVLNNEELKTSYLNSIIYTSLGVAFTLLVTVFAAYPLSRGKFGGKKSFTIIFTITMFFNGGMIPTYLVIDKLGLIDTLWSVVLPPAFNVFYILLMRTAFADIPESMCESAYIDGAGEFKILFEIMIPLSKAMLATVGLFAAILYWNDFYTPLLYLNDTNKFPLTIVLKKILLASTENAELALAYTKKGAAGAGYIQSIRMASAIVVLLPIMAIYPFIQRYFIKGIMIGSVKG